ncbi:hypothetical protein ACWGJ9_07300 [Curtobacterium citreum]
MTEPGGTVQVPVSLNESIADELEYRVRTVASRVRMAEKHDEPYPREWVDNEVGAGRERVRALVSQTTPTAEPDDDESGWPEPHDLPPEPPRIEDMAPGRRWPEGVYAINFQPGYYPSIVIPDADGEDLLYEDGTWWNPSEGDTLTRLDPSTIRDVTPPAGGARG